MKLKPDEIIISEARLTQTGEIVVMKILVTVW